MNFLEAHRIVKAFGGGPPLSFVLGMSGTGEPLDVYLRAAAAERGHSATVRFWTFSTLRQSLLQERAPNELEVLLLFPWDVVPALDWRTGVMAAELPWEQVRVDVDEFAARLAARGSPIVYVDAPGAPLWLAPHRNDALRSLVRATLEELGALVLPSEAFSQASHLSSGQPVAIPEVGAVARAIIDRALSVGRGSAKLLVTDLDHTLWHGIIGDDGPDGIHFRAEGKGYRHFVYQTLLRRLRNDGVILAAVSKNDDAVARAPFLSREMLLVEDDFVAIVASWQPKSAQIAMLAEQLNLGLDTFVFVDDNPVEIAEVAASLPQVRCVPFPSNEHGLAELSANLVSQFARETITTEDRERTTMYRRRLATLPPREAAASDLREFLRQLDMNLVIEERTRGDRTRAVQLINKTNQFNINGRRLDDTEVQQLLDAGARLFTAALSDRSGDHGQVLAALLSSDGTLTSMVMSCRVFQRRVEHAFFGWLLRAGLAPSAIDYVATGRNTPVRDFLQAAFRQPVTTGPLQVGWNDLAADLEDALSLFTVHAPGARS